MRICGGKHKRRALKAPPDRSIRPTSDRAREAIFNLLAHSPAITKTGFTLEGATVLDAFCGTGALGLEALSRGAAAATFLDDNAKALDLARANAEALGEAERAVFICANATDPPTAPRTHDLILLDPPYGCGLGESALTALSARGWIAQSGVVALEQAADETIDPPPGFTLIDQRRHGAAGLAILRYETSRETD